MNGVPLRIRPRTHDSKETATDKMRRDAIVQGQDLRDRCSLYEPMDRWSALRLAVVVRAAASREEAQTRQRDEAARP